MGEPYLKNLIQTGGQQDFCSYCDEETVTLAIEEIANIVERAFDEHYERTAAEPDDWVYATDGVAGWERDGEMAKWVIVNAAEVSEAIAEDFRSVLHDRQDDHELAQMGEECPFSEEAHYEQKSAGHGEFLRLWSDFELGLKTQARFFSPLAKSILDHIFAGVSDLRTVQGQPVVVKAGPGAGIATLFRARVFAGEDEKLKEALKAPWKHLGTPPHEAADAGRMNARGIAVFYGARDPETALSEVRPPVGSKGAVATFNIARSLRLLDLTALRSVSAGGSIFNPATLPMMQKANFLEILSHRMSRPVMPHEEASEYLPTQAVADYLANEAKLDGIIFPSIQTGQQSSNVVLFHHAARVAEVELPQGTAVDARLETYDSDGIHPEYTVWERVPPPAIQNEPRSHAAHGGLGMWPPFDGDMDTRTPTLRIDLENIRIHHIEAVSFFAPSHNVSRHRTGRIGGKPWLSESTTMTDEDFDNPFGL